MSEPRLRLRLYFANGLMFGPGKAELLEGIDTHGSISAAGRVMGMSYKRAWSLVEEMNAAFHTPLVASTRGGAQGGGAHLTETGHKVLAHYRNLMAQTESHGAADIAGIGALLASSDISR
jgi:molybdate transport system regulatory protein